MRRSFDSTSTEPLSLSIEEPEISITAQISRPTETILEISPGTSRDCSRDSSRNNLSRDSFLGNAKPGASRDSSQEDLSRCSSPGTLKPGASRDCSRDSSREDLSRDSSPGCAKRQVDRSEDEDSALVSITFPLYF